jgi:hypothetical protein
LEPPKQIVASDSLPPLILLTYDHGGLVLWGRDHFKERLENAISWLDKYPGFKIGLDNEAQVYDAFAESDPELLRLLREKLGLYAGRFGIGSCTYGQPLSTFVNEESNVRQIEYALRADRLLDVTPTVYLMSEHAMHSQVPQILNGFGFKAAIMRTHYMMYGYNPTYDAPFGWWVGLDGSRIPTVPTYTGEGAEFGKTPIDNWILTRYPGPECKTTPADFRRQFRAFRPLLATRADDSGLRQEGLVREVEGCPDYRWILLEELPFLYPEPEAEFKTVPNDFKTRMPWGYCGNEIWNLNRKAEVQALTAERLAAIRFLLAGKNNEADLDRSWKSLLVAQHHDIQICGILPDARKFLPASLEASGKVLADALKTAASKMKDEGLGQVTAFNPLSWLRDQWIEAELPRLSQGQASTLAVRYRGRNLPLVLLNANRYADGSLRDGRIGFPAQLPGLSLVSFSILGLAKPDTARKPRISVDRERLCVTTPFAEVRLDPSGGIASWKNLRSNRPFLKLGVRSGFFAGRIGGEDMESRGKWTLETQGDPPLRVVAREIGSIGDIPYVLEVVFGAETAEIDCRVNFHFQGQTIGRVTENQREAVSPFEHQYKLRFKLFPAAGDSAVGVRDLPFAVAETKDRTIEGNYWTALSDGRTGIAFFNRGTMGSVRENDGGFSIPLAYSMYYIWGTRMLDGDFSYDFAVHAFTGHWRDADLLRKALAFNFPAVSMCGMPGDGGWGDTVRPIGMDADRILLSALYVNRGQVLARLYESGGSEGGTLMPQLPDGYRLVETDLTGNGDNSVTGPLVFDPWRIRTFRIEKKNTSERSGR